MAPGDCDEEAAREASEAAQGDAPEPMECEDAGEQEEDIVDTEEARGSGAQDDAPEQLQEYEEGREEGGQDAGEAGLDDRTKEPQERGEAGYDGDAEEELCMDEDEYSSHLPFLPSSESESDKSRSKIALIGEESQSQRVHPGAKSASDYAGQSRKRPAAESSKPPKKKTTAKRLKQVHSHNTESDVIPSPEEVPTPLLPSSPVTAPDLSKYCFQPQEPAKITVVSSQIVTYNQDRKLSFDPLAIISDDEEDDFDIFSDTPTPKVPLPKLSQLPVLKAPGTSSNRLSEVSTQKLRNLLDLLTQEADLLSDPSAVKSVYESIDDPLPEEIDEPIKGICTINFYKSDFDKAMDRIRQREQNKEAEVELQAYIHDANEHKKKLDAFDADLQIEKKKVSDVMIRIKELEAELEKAKVDKESAFESYTKLKADAKSQRLTVKQCGLKVMELEGKIPKVPGTTEEDTTFINKARDIIGNTYAAIDKVCK